MVSQRAWIKLSEGLSWLAFGAELDQAALLQKLAGSDYSTEMRAALENALAALLVKARDGVVAFQGKFLEVAADRGTSAQTADIPAEKLADYRAYDITTDGLRYGQGLLWLPERNPEPDGGYTYAYRKLTRDEHFVDVYLNSVQLKQNLKAGRTSAVRLSDPELKRWWCGLSDSEKKYGEFQHREMLKKAFPHHHVSRAGLRLLRGELPRTRGRRGKSP